MWLFRRHNIPKCHVGLLQYIATEVQLGDNLRVILCRCWWCRAGANRTPHNNSYVSLTLALPSNRATYIDHTGHSYFFKCKDTMCLSNKQTITTIIKCIWGYLTLILVLSIKNRRYKRIFWEYLTCWSWIFRKVFCLILLYLVQFIQDFHN